MRAWPRSRERRTRSRPGVISTADAKGKAEGNAEAKATSTEDKVATEAASTEDKVTAASTVKAQSRRPRPRSSARLRPHQRRPAAHKGMSKIAWTRPGAVFTADAKATSTADEVASKAASAAYKVMAE